MAPAPLALHWAQDERGHVCAICQTDIAEGEPVGRCPSCDAPFHGQCWEENGGCASYGCPEVPAVSKAEAPAEGSSWWGQDDKECPRCGSRIRLAALRCRHCGQTFESRAPSAGPAEARAARPRGAAAVWLFVLGLIPFTAPLVLVLGGLGLFLARRRVRRWPATRRAMAIVSIAAAAVVSLLVGLVVLLHEPEPRPGPAAPPDAAQTEGAGEAEDADADAGVEAGADEDEAEDAAGDGDESAEAEPPAPREPSAPAQDGAKRGAGRRERPKKAAPDEAGAPASEPDPPRDRSRHWQGEPE